jgi:hypothetical protein
VAPRAGTPRTPPRGCVPRAACARLVAGPRAHWGSERPVIDNFSRRVLAWTVAVRSTSRYRLPELPGEPLHGRFGRSDGRPGYAR